MGGIFSPPKPSTPPPPPPPPERSQADIQAAATEQRLRASRQRGRASTILTGGTQGAATTGETVQRKTLLGQ